MLSRRDVLRSATASAVLAAQPSARAGAASFDWDSADALAMAQAVSQRRVSAEELLTEAQRRLDKVNPVLNVLAQDHRTLAHRLVSDTLPKGPFCGVPFLLKDLGVQLAGTVTSEGSALMQSVVAASDSTLVTRLKQTGVVIFGKTNTPEFGMALTTEGRHLGDCRNPWHVEHSTGGSSGGSAAAVAAGVLPMAHGTDGGGSIRVPANHCGVFGFKPTRGMTPGSSGAGMSVGHVLSRSVRDSALMLELTGGYEAGAPYGAGLRHDGLFEATLRAPRPLRVALNMSEPDVAIDPDVRAVIDHTAAVLVSLGHHVEQAAPGIDYVHLNDVQNTLMISGMSAWLDFVERERGRAIAPNELEPMNHMIRREGAKVTGAEVAAALEAMHALGRHMGRFHEQYDVVLQPVTATPAPPLGAIVFRAGDDLASYTQRFKRIAAFTHLYNMTGQPSMSVPMGMSSQGLPIGAMLSAAVGADSLLLSLAAQLERAQPWWNQRPPVGT